MGIRVLYISEVVGKAGIWCIKQALPALKKAEQPDCVIVNADGTTGGAGIGKQHAGYLRKLGADLLIGSDYAFFRKDLVENIASVPWFIRPANYPPESPGFGWRYVKAGKARLAVISLLGRVGFGRVHGENPFLAVTALSERLRAETPFILVDFHSGATAEKQAFFFHSDGKVSAVIGSHSRVRTADPGILPGGTAVITDAGRTGSQDSVGGAEPNLKIREYRTGIPDWSRDAWGKPCLQGLIIEMNDDGKATAIRPVSVSCTVPEEEGTDKNHE